jgi:hypothetical protein
MLAAVKRRPLKARACKYCSQQKTTILQIYISTSLHLYICTYLHLSHLYTSTPLHAGQLMPLLLVHPLLRLPLLLVGLRLIFLLLPHPTELVAC